MHALPASSAPRWSTGSAGWLPKKTSAFVSENGRTRFSKRLRSFFLLQFPRKKYEGLYVEMRRPSQTATKAFVPT
jgi:hypothetical protein